MQRQRLGARRRERRDGGHSAQATLPAPFATVAGSGFSGSAVPFVICCAQHMTNNVALPVMLRSTGFSLWSKKLRLD